MLAASGGPCVAGLASEIATNKSNKAERWALRTHVAAAAATTATAAAVNPVDSIV
jgi:hypothetical protein